MTATIEKTLPETFEVGQKIIVTDTIGAYEAVLGSLVTVRRTGLGFSGLLVEVEDADGVTYQMYAERFRSLREGDRVLVDYQASSAKAKATWDGPATVRDVRHDYFTAPISVVTDSGKAGAFGYEDIKALPVEEELAEWEKELLGIFEEPVKVDPLVPGDRVVYTAGYEGYNEQRRIGKTGTVIAYHNAYDPTVTVEWDDDRGRQSVYAENVALHIEEFEAERQLQVGDKVTGYGNWVGTIKEIYGETRWGHGDCLVHWHGSLHGKTLGATLWKLTLVEAVEDRPVAPVIEADVIATIEDIDAFRAVNVEGAVLRSPRTGKVYGKFGNMWQTVGTEESAGWSVLRLVEDGVPFQVLFLPI